MEIKLIIDDRIVQALRKVLRRPVLAGAAGVLAFMGGIGAVYGVGSLTTFTPGTTISAAEVNANFATLRDAVEALENEASPFADCTTNYGAACGPNADCITSCPVGQVPISGGCDTAGGGLVMENYPAGPSGSVVEDGDLSELGRWVCKTDAGTVWPFVICCTL